MVRDEKNPEDIDTELEDHAVDSCRYMLSHVSAPSKKDPKPPILQQKIEELLIMPDDNSDGWS